MEKLFGFSRRSAVITFKNFQDCIHPDDYEFVNKTYSKAITGINDIKIRHRIIDQFGIIHWIEVIGKITDLNGISTHFVGILREIEL